MSNKILIAGEICAACVNRKICKYYGNEMYDMEQHINEVFRDSHLLDNAPFRFALQCDRFIRDSLIDNRFGF